VKAFDQGDIIVGHPHPSPAAARDGFNHDRVANALGHRQGILLRVHHAV